jgi:hypothetical protein
MPDLNFTVERVEPEPFAAAPMLIFKLGIEQVDDALPIHSIALRCQIRLDPAKRHYSDAEKRRLLELFGEPSRWSQTLRSMLWVNASVIVSAFTSNTLADLPVPCTFDFNVAMTKYFDALEEGDVPLSFLFSGTIFYQNESDALQAAPISWEKEAQFRLPVSVWRQMMDQHYPNTAALMLNKNTFDRLRDYKTQLQHVTWEKAIEELLDAADQKVQA